MAADNEIHDESEYNKLVKTLKEKRETIKKWAAENGVNLSPKSIQKKRNQHYVPRCYLELWRDSDNSLYQSIKGGKPIRIMGDLKKIAQSKDFYSSTDHRRRQKFIAWTRKNCKKSGYI